VGVIEMRHMFGEEWIDKLLSFETVDKFNELCPCEILLETKEVYDGSAE
jgi:hypothetical protein